MCTFNAKRGLLFFVVMGKVSRIVLRANLEMEFNPKNVLKRNEAQRKRETFSIRKPAAAPTFSDKTPHKTRFLRGDNFSLNLAGHLRKGSFVISKTNEGKLTPKTHKTHLPCKNIFLISY